MIRCLRSNQVTGHSEVIGTEFWILIDFDFHWIWYWFDRSDRDSSFMLFSLIGSGRDTVSGSRGSQGGTAQLGPQPHILARHHSHHHQPRTSARYHHHHHLPHLTTIILVIIHQCQRKTLHWGSTHKVHYLIGYFFFVHVFAQDQSFQFSNSFNI